jgi:hypothetical protein
MVHDHDEVRLAVERGEQVAPVEEPTIEVLIDDRRPVSSPVVEVVF